MEIGPVLTIALIVAITSFFKKHLGLTDKWALLAAFIVSLVIGLTPQLVLVLPVLGPWVEAVINVVILFLSAAGSFDFVMEVRTRTASQ